ncbi:hypothetical protein OH77DRAFT_995474 [Trametes cingulata]|nr:hypothetical protein OH77DRAFT_995474 [Trametes cingulata]
MRCVRRLCLRLESSDTCGRCLLLLNAFICVPYVNVPLASFLSLLDTHTKPPIYVLLVYSLLARLLPSGCFFLVAQFIVHVVAKASPLSPISCIHMSLPVQLTIRKKSPRSRLWNAPATRCTKHFVVPPPSFPCVIVACDMLPTLYDIQTMSNQRFAALSRCLLGPGDHAGGVLGEIAPWALRSIPAGCCHQSAVFRSSTGPPQTSCCSLHRRQSMSCQTGRP